MQKGKIDEFVAARKGSPLLIGIGRNEYYVASDATPIVEYTNNVIYLEDGHIARINKNENIEIKNINNKNITPYIQELKLNIDAIEKGGLITSCSKRYMNNQVAYKIPCVEDWIQLQKK